MARSQVDNAQVRDGPAGPLGPRSNLTRASVFFGPRACRASRDPVPAVRPQSSITFRIGSTTISNALIVTPKTGVSSFPGCPSLSQPSPGPAQTPVLADRGTARTVVSWPGLSRGDPGVRCAHSYTDATEATGTAGTEPQQPQQRQSSRGMGTIAEKRRRAPPGGRAVPARTVRPWGGRPVPSLSVAYPQSALVCDHQCRFSCYWRRIPLQVPVAASAQSNYNICGRV